MDHRRCWSWLASAIAAFGLPFQRDLLIVGSFFLGVSAQSVKICVDTTVQQQVDDAYRGRVFSVYDMAFNVTYVAAAAVAATVLPKSGKSFVVMACLAGGYVLAATIFAWLSARTRTRAAEAPAAAATGAGVSAAAGRDRNRKILKWGVPAAVVRLRYASVGCHAKVEEPAVEPSALTATEALFAGLLPDDPETVIDRLENRLAGQTSEVLRMRKSAQTSQALLDLHTACTRQRTVAGTARQIAAVASAITGSEVVIVSVFQVASQQPLLAVSLSDGVVDEEHIGNLVCDMATQPDMQWLRTENSLRVVDRESATPSTALLLAELHAQRVLMTPVFGQGEFVGCIVAKLPHSRPTTTMLPSSTAPPRCRSMPVT